MDYRTTEAGHHPRTCWKPHQIPDLACIRATKSVSADPDRATTPSTQSDWLPVYHAIVRALAPYPQAQRDVVEAVKPYRSEPKD